MALPVGLVATLETARSKSPLPVAFAILGPSTFLMLAFGFLSRDAGANILGVIRRLFRGLEQRLSVRKHLWRGTSPVAVAEICVAGADAGNVGFSQVVPATEVPQVGLGTRPGG